MIYTDETILTFGRYKFTKLCRIDPDYLLEFLNNKTFIELHNYVVENLEKIIMRKEGIIETPKLEFPCIKITYANEKIANQVLSSIKSIDQTHKKPIRAYECDKCGCWHLTSKP